MNNCCCKNKLEDPKQERLREYLAEIKDTKGSLIPALQKAQEIYGFLPSEVMQFISQELNIPFSRVYGAATFYAQFHLKPRGRNIIRVCTGTACHVKGADNILQSLQETLGINSGETTSDLRFTLETVACLGACGLAPAIMVNEDTYGRLTPSEAVKVLAQYK